MEVQASLRILRDELQRRGLPRSYIARVSGELAEHAADLAAASPPGTARSSPSPHPAAQLGEPLQLANQIAREYQRRTFLGRHPWLTFAALPAGAMLATCVATMLGMVFAVELILYLGGDAPSAAFHWTAATIAGSLAVGMTYGLPIVLCWWSLRIARRTTRGWTWVWLNTAVLVATSFIFRIHVFRLDDGQFAIDSSGALRVAVNYLLSGEILPVPVLLGWLLPSGAFLIGYLLQAAFLIGGTAVIIRHHQRALASAVTPI